MGRVVMRYPDVPPELDDRAQDGWEPLLAIAESAGQLAQARRAAVALHTSGDHEDPSLGVRLLADLCAVFGDADRMTTAELVGKLNALEESPWGGFGDAGMTARVLARMLRPYGVSPKKIRVGDESVRGYERVTFRDAWERYTRPGSPSGPEEAEQAEQCRSDPESHVEQSESVFHMKSPADQACSGVPLENADQGERPDAGYTESDDEDAEYEQALDTLHAEFNPVEIIRGDMPWAHVRGGDAA